MTKSIETRKSSWNFVKNCNIMSDRSEKLNFGAVFCSFNEVLFEQRIIDREIQGIFFQKQQKNWAEIFSTCETRNCFEAMIFHFLNKMMPSF